MIQTAEIVLRPRKQPIQARSAASVEAILEATIQVLLSVGEDRLTTTRVAARAGVSVGTLYQYFPNKRALMQACLKRHLEEVREEVVQVCRQQRSTTPREMTIALVTAFLAAKLNRVKASAAFYSVSSNVGGAAIVQRMSEKINRAVVEMLLGARPPLTRNPQIVASMLQGVMAGVTRRLLESKAPEEQADALREELIFLACAYVEACTDSRPGIGLTNEASTAVMARK